MKKIGLVTIIDNNNYGNRLQNYAVQTIIEKMNFKVITLKNKECYNDKKKFILRAIKSGIKRKKYVSKERKDCFRKFNDSYIKFSKNNVTAFSNISNKYDYFIVGSDQVWNPNFGRLRDVDLLKFANPNQRIAFSASFGVSKINKEDEDKVTKSLKMFKNISVREDTGKEIVNRLTDRKDIEVLIDPTMLLTTEEWNKIAEKPRQFELLKNKKYILNYFLGELSKKRKEEIQRIAKENDCEIINILSKEDPFYNTGPSEFVYLEKNAFLVCTDSFHSSIFAILYDRPFIVFEREGNGKGINSRIETLLSKFQLSNRKYNDKSITNENLNHDYIEAYRILEKEREKSINFLRKSLEI